MDVCVYLDYNILGCCYTSLSSLPHHAVLLSSLTVRLLMYIYIVFQHLVQWLVVIRMQSSLISAIERGRVDVVGAEGGLLVGTYD